jgi:ABC-type amino acid transport system permease subunit
MARLATLAPATSVAIAATMMNLAVQAVARLIIMESFLHLSRSVANVINAHNRRIIARR